MDSLTNTNKNGEGEGGVEGRTSDTATAGTSGGVLPEVSFFAVPTQRARAASVTSRRTTSPTGSAFTGMDESYILSDDEDDEDNMSVSSRLSLGSTKRKGRSLTVADCVELATKKRRYLKENSSMREIEVDRVLGINKKAKASKDLPKESFLAEQMVDKTIDGLHDQLDGALIMVNQVADTSSNIKATYKRELRIAALNAKAAVKEITNRIDPEAAGVTTLRLRKENARLKQEIIEVKRELEKMRGEMSALQSTRRRRIIRSPSPEGGPTLESLQCSEDSEMVVEREEGRENIPVSSPILTMIQREEKGGKKEGARKKPPTPPTAKKVDARPTAPDELMTKIGNLIEAKLTAFREELFPGRTIRPPLKGSVDNRIPSPVISAREPVTEEGNKGKKKGQGGKAGWVAPPPPSGSGTIQGKEAPSTSQLQPSDESSWAKVVGRKKGKKGKSPTTTPVPPLALKPQPKPKGQGSGGKANRGPGAGQGTGKERKKKETGEKARKARPGRLPKSAAVTLTAPEGTTYASVLTKAKQSIRLADLGITDTVRLRRAVTGAYIIEIPGVDSTQKADRLKEELGKIFTDSGVKVARPTKRAELRIRGLDDSITADEILTAVAQSGDCEAGEVKVGEIRSSPFGLGTVWVQCPLAAARKLASDQKIKVGWSSLPVEFLETRQLQCYRCLEKGHVGQRCTSTVDRSGRCYRCGSKEHIASQCSATPKCPLCADLGKPADHRLGAKACQPLVSKRGRKAIAVSTKVTEPSREAPISTGGTAPREPIPTGSPGQEEAMVIGDE